MAAALSTLLVGAGTGGVAGGQPAAVPAAQPGGPQLAEPVPPPDPPGDIDEDRPPSALDPVITPEAAPVRAIRFPVDGPVHFTDTFGACRDGCTRRHMGNDLFVPKLSLLRAARDGHVTWLRTDASGTAGNGVGITDGQGWRYLYLHVNNDTPGTDDGRNPAGWRFTRVVRMGAKVYQGQVLGWSGDSGNAETTPPHLHFEIRQPNLVTIDPFPSLVNANRNPPVPRLYRFDALRGGAADDHIPFAPAQAHTVMACDVDGNGTDEPVAHTGNTFSAIVSPLDLRTKVRVPYGRSTDVGMCGDWDGNGTATPGVKRGQLVLLRNSWAGGAADVAFTFGGASDRLVVGDWNGDGQDTLAAVRGAQWYFTDTNGVGPITLSVAFGRPGDAVFAGDWNGDGRDTIGVRRGPETFVRDVLRGGVADRRYVVGTTGDVPVVARWTTGDVAGVDTISLWRRFPP